MDGPLSYQEKIPLKPSGECEIIDYVSEGGQGYIYATNKRRMLKWYKIGDNIGSIQSNIEELTKMKCPYPNLTWPLQMTKDYKNSFGYLMPRIPNGYVSLKHYIYDDKYNLNIDEMLQIGYAIASTFHAIHKEGYVYQDINPGGILINKQLQSVIICDVDNCNKNRQIFVSGTPMYMAPEIVMEMDDPNLYTDYYSLSVILFQLFYIDHPLEGRKTWSKPLDKTDEREYFGKHPVFVCDPVDHSNGFYKDCTSSVEKRWHRFPTVLEDTFIRAFTTGLKSPQRRITDKQWMEVIKLSYDRLVKKKFDGMIRQGFFPIDSNDHLKICVNDHQTLISEYKKIYGYIFDEEDMFLTVLFECDEDHYITVKCDELYINRKKMMKGDRMILRVHDILQYHGIKGIVSV